MSASEALTIWIFSTAMNAPSVAPATASQIFGETAGSDALAALVVCARSPLTLAKAAWSMGGWSAVIWVPSCSQRQSASGGQFR